MKRIEKFKLIQFVMELKKSSLLILVMLRVRIVYCTNNQNALGEGDNIASYPDNSNNYHDIANLIGRRPYPVTNIQSNNNENQLPFVVRKNDQSQNLFSLKKPDEKGLNKHDVKYKANSNINTNHLPLQQTKDINPFQKLLFTDRETPEFKKRHIRNYNNPFQLEPESKLLKPLKCFFTENGNCSNYQHNPNEANYHHIFSTNKVDLPNLFSPQKTQYTFNYHSPIWHQRSPLQFLNQFFTDGISSFTKHDNVPQFPIHHINQLISSFSKYHNIPQFPIHHINQLISTLKGSKIPYQFSYQYPFVRGGTPIQFLDHFSANAENYNPLEFLGYPQLQNILNLKGSKYPINTYQVNGANLVYPQSTPYQFSYQYPFVHQSTSIQLHNQLPAGIENCSPLDYLGNPQLQNMLNLKGSKNHINTYQVHGANLANPQSTAYPFSYQYPFAHQGTPMQLHNQLPAVTEIRSPLDYLGNPQLQNLLNLKGSKNPINAYQVNGANLVNPQSTAYPFSYQYPFVHQGTPMQLHNQLPAVAKIRSPLEYRGNTQLQNKPTNQFRLKLKGSKTPINPNQVDGANLVYPQSTAYQFSYQYPLVHQGTPIQLHNQHPADVEKRSPLQYLDKRQVQNKSTNQFRLKVKGSKNPIIRNQVDQDKPQFQIQPTNQLKLSLKGSKIPINKNHIERTFESPQKVPYHFSYQYPLLPQGPSVHQFSYQYPIVHQSYSTQFPTQLLTDAENCHPFEYLGLGNPQLQNKPTNEFRLKLKSSKTPISINQVDGPNFVNPQTTVHQFSYQYPIVHQSYSTQFPTQLLTDAENCNPYEYLGLGNPQLQNKPTNEFRLKLKSSKTPISINQVDGPNFVNPQTTVHQFSYQYPIVHQSYSTQFPTQLFTDAENRSPLEYLGLGNPQLQNKPTNEFRLKLKGSKTPTTINQVDGPNLVNSQRTVHQQFNYQYPIVHQSYSTQFPTQLLTDAENRNPLEYLGLGNPQLQNKPTNEFRLKLKDYKAPISINQVDSPNLVNPQRTVHQFSYQYPIVHQSYSTQFPTQLFTDADYRSPLEYLGLGNPQLQNIPTNEFRFKGSKIPLTINEVDGLNLVNPQTTVQQFSYEYPILHQSYSTQFPTQLLADAENNRSPLEYLGLNNPQLQNKPTNEFRLKLKGSKSPLTINEVDGPNLVNPQRTVHQFSYEYPILHQSYSTQFPTQLLADAENYRSPLEYLGLNNPQLQNKPTNEFRLKLKGSKSPLTINEEDGPNLVNPQRTVHQFSYEYPILHQSYSTQFPTQLLADAENYRSPLEYLGLNNPQLQNKPTNEFRLKLKGSKSPLTINEEDGPNLVNPQRTVHQFSYEYPILHQSYSTQFPTQLLADAENYRSPLEYLGLNNPQLQNKPTNEFRLKLKGSKSPLTINEEDGPNLVNPQRTVHQFSYEYPILHQSYSTQFPTQLLADAENYRSPLEYLGLNNPQLQNKPTNEFRLKLKGSKSPLTINEEDGPNLVNPQRTVHQFSYEYPILHQSYSTQFPTQLLADAENYRSPLEYLGLNNPQLQNKPTNEFRLKLKGSKSPLTINEEDGPNLVNPQRTVHQFSYEYPILHQSYSTQFPTQLLADAENYRSPLEYLGLNNPQLQNKPTNEFRLKLKGSKSPLTINEEDGPNLVNPQRTVHQFSYEYPILHQSYSTQFPTQLLADAENYRSPLEYLGLNNPQLQNKPTNEFRLKLKDSKSPLTINEEDGPNLVNPQRTVHQFSYEYPILHQSYSTQFPTQLLADAENNRSPLEYLGLGNPQIQKKPSNEFRLKLKGPQNPINTDEVDHQDVSYPPKNSFKISYQYPFEHRGYSTEFPKRLPIDLENLGSFAYQDNPQLNKHTNQIQLTMMLKNSKNPINMNEVDVPNLFYDQGYQKQFPNLLEHNPQFQNNPINHSGFKFKSYQYPINMNRPNLFYPVHPQKIPHEFSSQYGYPTQLSADQKTRGNLYFPYTQLQRRPLNPLLLKYNIDQNNPFQYLTDGHQINCLKWFPKPHMTIDIYLK